MNHTDGSPSSLNACRKAGGSFTIIRPQLRRSDSGILSGRMDIVFRRLDALSTSRSHFARRTQVRPASAIAATTFRLQAPHKRHRRMTRRLLIGHVSNLADRLYCIDASETFPDRELCVP